MAKKCELCGAELNANVKYCSSCGAKVADSNYEDVDNIIEWNDLRQIDTFPSFRMTLILWLFVVLGIGSVIFVIIWKPELIIYNPMGVFGFVLFSMILWSLIFGREIQAKRKFKHSAGHIETYAIVDRLGPSIHGNFGNYRQGYPDYCLYMHLENGAEVRFEFQSKAPAIEFKKGMKVPIEICGDLYTPLIQLYE